MHAHTYVANPSRLYDPVGFLLHSSTHNTEHETNNAIWFVSPAHKGEGQGVSNLFSQSAKVNRTTRLKNIK